MKIRWLVLPLALLAASCESPEDELDGADDAFVNDGKSDVAGIADGTAEACGVLELASSASRQVLDDEAGLTAQAVGNLVAWRVGPDGQENTDDDQIFDDLAELDAVRYIGPASFHRLLAYSRDHAFTCSQVALQLQQISDWHGQLDPLTVPMVGNVGGAAALSTIFKNGRKLNRRTLTLTAGDAFGATPPLASFFEEKTAVLAMNLMGFSADGLGNHNFDRGIEHLQRMIDLAAYPFLSANLEGVEDVLAGVDPYRIFAVGGVRVAVIGVTNADAEALTKPGSFGGIHVGNPVVAALMARDQAAADGAQVFVLIAHMGATGAIGSSFTGPLMDLARGVSGFDVILGDHTNVVVNGEVNGTPVVEQKSSGGSYARITLTYDFGSGRVVEHQVDVVTPMADAVTPDPAIVDLLAPYRRELASLFDKKIAETSDLFLRGNNVERLGEVALGDLVAEALRLRYGTQLGFTNGGGLRAPLPSSYAPQDTTLRRPMSGFAAGPPWDLVVGDVYSVLPFGNNAVTRPVTGEQLWRMLEHSVEALPSANGWFGQIAGFRFTFDSRRPAGARVVSVTLADGTPLSNDATSYTLATSDFVAAGGDGYTMLNDGQGVSRERMAEILQDYLTSRATLVPATDGRIKDVALP